MTSGSSDSNYSKNLHSNWAFSVYCIILLLVTSESLQPHGVQHARLPCPSLSPGVCSNSCPLSRWCHPTISMAPSPPALNHSQHRVFSNELALHIRWLKYWNFSFSISPSSEYSGSVGCMVVQHGSFWYVLSLNSEHSSQRQEFWQLDLILIWTSQLPILFFCNLLYSCISFSSIAKWGISTS